MDTVTKTFSLELKPDYVPGSIIELIHFRDLEFNATDRIAIYLDSFYIKVYLPSFQLGKFPELEGYESDAEKLVAYTVVELASQKIGLQILDRKNNTGEWSETSKAVLTNRGREDYFDLMSPYLGASQSRSMEKNDAMAVGLIDYGNGLLWDTDSLRITATATVIYSKKNDYLTPDSVFEILISNSSTEVCVEDLERQMIKIFCLGPATCWIKYGGGGEINTFSHPLPPGHMIVIEKQAHLAIFAISTSESSSLRVSCASIL